MASYGKDDFYYGSDISDFSENEAELEYVSDGSFGSDDDDIARYCVCSLPATTEMIACDAQSCKIEWFHYQCVGITPDTIPEDSWLCEFCRPAEDSSSPCIRNLDHGPSTSSATIQQIQTASTSDGASSSTTSKISSSKSKTKINSKGDDVQKKTSKNNTTKSKVKRPKPTFDSKHAHQNAVGYFKTGLQMMTTNRVFCGKFPNAVAVIGLVTALLCLHDSPEFIKFSQNIVSSLWTIATAGDEKFLKPEAAELMWKTFHEFKLESIKDWMTFLISVNIDTTGQHVLIVYQYIVQTILTILIKDRNSMDLPQIQSTEDVLLSKEEEQVLRYVAGYVPFSLYEKYRKQKNETASKFCEILKTWRACSSDTEKTFLEYTNEWISLQNRGGLFNVNDDVYIFFRTLENESRPFLTRNSLDQLPGIDIKSKLKEKILSQARVHSYWCNITKGIITGNVSKKLMDNVINLWVKIRIKAFVKVYLDLKKYRGNEKVSKKGEKALRKTLSS